MPKAKKKAPLKLGRPTKYSPAILKKAEEYLELCQDEIDEFWKTRGEKSDSYDRLVVVNIPTVDGLALHLDVSRDTIQEWGNVHPAFSVTISKLKSIQASRLIKGGLSGDYNPMMAKFLLSANHGMRERVDTTTDDKPLPQAVTINNYHNLSDDELIALARGGQKGAGA
ncbi:terminase small subunit [Palleronia sp. KMU-117]|uniref:terminase small subunit n=1 Tax=Palleronia sp. KMU-117 TaxID=3434108 RepID=UPI003D758CFB